jgi:hypothetical protein
MSILSNHHVEVLDELNGHGPEDDMGHEACGQAFPDEPTEADWQEYAEWSASLDRQQAAQDAAAEPKPSTNGKPARKPRPKRRRVFNITFTIDGTAYKVYPLACDPSIGQKAFRFCKQSGDGEVYDLHADAFGVQCQCKGFLAHGHCKHMETVQAAAKVFCLK